MLLFDWIKRQVATAVREGIAQGASESGLVTGKTEAEAQDQLRLVLANGTLKPISTTKRETK